MAEDVEIFSVELQAHVAKFEKAMEQASNRSDASLSRIEKKLQHTNNRLKKGLQFRGFDNASNAAFRGVEQRMNNLRGLLMGGVATFGVSLGASELLRSLQEEEEAARRLEAVLRTTGYAAALSQKDIAKWADDLERRTGRSAAEIQKVAAQLATFTSIGRGEFLKAIEVADDLAATFGGDLQSNLDAVARALDDPIKGFGNLQKRGFALTQSELERVKAHLRAGESAKAQGVILDNLAKQVQGAAEATNQGLTKAMNDMRKAAGDAFKTFADQRGTAAAIAAFNALGDAARWTGEHMDEILNAAQVLATFVGVRYVAGMGLAAAATLAQASAAVKAKGAIEALTVAMAKNPATLIALAAAAAAAGIFELDRRMREAQASAADLRNANEGLKKSLDAYEEAARAAAVATGEEAKMAREAAAAKRAEAVANLEAARAKLADAQATIAQINAKAAQQNEFERYNIRGDRPASFGQGSMLSRQERDTYRMAVEDRQRLLESISSAQQVIDEADKILSSGGSTSIEYEEKDKKNGADKAKQRKRLLEDLKAQTDLTVAQLDEEVALVRQLERQAEITARIRSLEDAGVSAREAATISAGIQAKLDEARLRAMDREEDLLVRSIDLEVARTDETWATVRAIEEEVELRELTAAFAKVSTDRAAAEAKAQSTLVMLQSARADAAKRGLDAAREEHRLTVAQLSGNRELAKVLQDQAAIRERTLRYQQEFRLSPEDAATRARDEVAIERKAATYGEQRDMFATAFSDGVRAAMSGDLTNFLSNQFGNFADNMLKRAGEQLFDMAFGGVDAVAEGAAQGAAMSAAVGPAIVTAGAAAATAMSAAITAAGVAAGSAMATQIAAASAAKSFLPGFSSGGYTGPGPLLQPKGVVHAREIVWSHGDIARAGGVAVVEAMRRGLPGYATGGVVGRAVPIHAAVSRVQNASRQPVIVEQHLHNNFDGAVMTEDLLREMDAKANAARLGAVAQVASASSEQQRKARFRTRV